MGLPVSPQMQARRERQRDWPCLLTHLQTAGHWTYLPGFTCTTTSAYRATTFGTGMTSCSILHPVLGRFYQEARSSTQSAGIFDFLAYFRRRNNRIRPYLAVGVGVSHLASTRERLIASSGGPVLPLATFSYTGPVLRSHVGIDLRSTRKVDFRYSFSETLGHNEISEQLSPPAPHKLANFQNLFGFVIRL